MVMKSVYVLAALAALTTSAAAGGFDVQSRCTYSRFYGSQCDVSVRHEQPVDPVQARLDAEERERSIAKWEAFCRPKKTYDSEGIARLVYAAEGCEFGRSE